METLGGLTEDSISILHSLGKAISQRVGYQVFSADTSVFTEPSVYARARILESAHARSITIVITLTGSIWKTSGKRQRLNKKKLATLHQVIFQVEFSLLLAFLGPLEGSAVEKVHEMLPTTQEAVYLCN